MPARLSRYDLLPFNRRRHDDKRRGVPILAAGIDKRFQGLHGIGDHLHQVIVSADSVQFQDIGIFLAKRDEFFALRPVGFSSSRLLGI